MVKSVAICLDEFTIDFRGDGVPTPGPMFIDRFYTFMTSFCSDLKFIVFIQKVESSQIQVS